VTLDASQILHRKPIPKAVKSMRSYTAGCSDVRAMAHRRPVADGRSGRTYDGLAKMASRERSLDLVVRTPRPDRLEAPRGTYVLFS